MAGGRPAFEPTDKQRGEVEAMVRYGIPESEIAEAVGIAKGTLLKHFEIEIKAGATKANAQVGEFLFSTIVGIAIPNRPPVTDDRARVTAAIFWAKTRMGWRETNVHEHTGKIKVEVSAVRERIARRLARLAADGAAEEDTDEPE